MMCENQDILQIISQNDIPKLRDLYKNYFPRTTYVYNFLNSAVKWKTRCPNKHYVTVMSPHGNWQNGTFVAVHQCNGYEVFISTLEQNDEVLHEIIVNTKRIDWSKRMLVYAVHNDHHVTVFKALCKTKFALLRKIPCIVWWMPSHKALQLKLNCPPEIYVAKLNQTHACAINFHWPHNFAGSEKYVAFIIEMNGGYGAFLKTSNKLVAWVLRIQMGLGMLHTLEEHKRKGYGSIVTKALAKEIAQEGIDPLATTVTTNKAAQAMFENMGFETSECCSVVYIESKQNDLI